MDILKLIQQRHSSRTPFDPDRPIPEAHLLQMLEAALWAPTAHNMQNFEVVVVDDRDLLDKLAKFPQETSRAFVEENYAQLSFSEEELKRKGTGLLATMFPPSWRSPGVKPEILEEHAHSILGASIKMCAALLVVLYDPRLRAPASEGDVLGMMSLGCVMENMWLVAESLGIGFQIQSAISADCPAVHALTWTRRHLAAEDLIQEARHGVSVEHQLTTTSLMGFLLPSRSEALGADSLWRHTKLNQGVGRGLHHQRRAADVGQQRRAEGPAHLGQHGAVNPSRVPRPRRRPDSVKA